MQLGEALTRALAAHGATEIFGIPGDFALPLFKSFEDCGILPLYTLSHEPAVGFAADASARMRCRPGVAAVTYGAGALNMVNAIAGAYAEKSPVVVISGAPGAHERRSGLSLHHQGRTLDSQLHVFAEITCDQAQLTDAATAPRAIARVLANCIRHSQPVYIEVPRDMVCAECGTVVREPEPPLDREALAACADEILARLAAAKSPVLMVGVEVRRYALEARVAELARRLQLPVVTSFMGRGLLSDSGAPVLGTYLGAAGAPAITRVVEGSDGLLLLGVILSDTNFGVSEKKIDLRRAIHAFDGRVTLGYHVYPDAPLAALVDALLERLPQTAVTKPAAAPAPAPRRLARDAQTIEPFDIAVAINDLMAAHGRMPIASDVGDCLFTALDIEHTALVAPGYYATMGFGIPAALGLQAATGQRPLVLVGDGAFQMTGMELGNCRRYGWDPIVIVFNNASWEMLRAFQPESGFNDLGHWNYAALACALGGDGVRVATRASLAAALAQAVATRGRFQLIETMLPAGARSPTLTRFVESVRRLTTPEPATT
jgi:indolepyruvate decarboxylase